MVDDHDVVRSGLTALLTAELGIDVVGQAADGPAAFAEAERLGPDVVLLDIDLPGVDGITVAAGLVERLPACRVLMLTALDRPGHLRRALAAGASGYLLKSTTPARTADAIRRIAAGGRVIDPRMHGEERAAPARSPTRRPRPSGWPPAGRTPGRSPPTCSSAWEPSATGSRRRSGSSTRAPSSTPCG